MSLADHYDGGEWLQDGWHTVAVETYKVFQFNTGSDGVEFGLVDSRGLKAKVSFCLVDTILWRLAEFAKACGLTREEAERYEPTSKNSHFVLVKRKLQVCLTSKAAVNKDGKDITVHEVVEWVGVDENVSNTPADPRADRSVKPEPPKDDGISF